MPEKIKKEVDEDTHIRKLFAFFVKEAEEDTEIELSRTDRAALVDDLVEDFGAAVSAVCGCAVDAAFAMILADEDEEDEEEGGDADGESIDAEFEEKEGGSDAAA